MKISEDQMILAFLQAEFQSPRFGYKYSQKYNLVYNPNLNDTKENKERRKILTKVRGFGNRKRLFKNFPNKIEKIECLEMSSEKLEKVKYLNHPDFNRLTNKSRFVKDGKENLLKIYIHNFTANVLDLVLKYVQKIEQPPVILAKDKEGLFLVEGHTRVTAATFLGLSIPTIVICVGNLGRWKTQKI